MSDGQVRLITPPSTLKARICDVDGGVTLEHLLAAADAILAGAADSRRLGGSVDTGELLRAPDPAPRSRSESDGPDHGM